MISTPDRCEAVELIEEAVHAGASAGRACAELGLSQRTYQRWTQGEGVRSDRRPQAQRPKPANQLPPQEREQILVVCNSDAYGSLPPSQIIPALADQGIYLASEATFYRVLRAAGQLHHRGKAQAPRNRSKPQAYRASGPNQVWGWDITFLASTVTGRFYRLYLVLDIYSRKIVAWEVHENESAEHAAMLIRKACLAERIGTPGLVLYADKGSTHERCHDAGDPPAAGYCAVV